MNKHDDWWKTQATHVDIADKNLKLKDCLSQIIPHISPAIKAGSRILDFGCGIGRLTIPMAQHHKAASLVGYDITEKFLDDAGKQATESGVKCFFTNKLNGMMKFDSAYSMMVLQHLTHPAKKQMIKSIANLLNKHGLVRLQYVEGDNHSFLTHDARQSEMDKWCSDAGLRIIDVEFNLLYPRWSWITAVKG